MHLFVASIQSETGFGKYFLGTVAQGGVAKRHGDALVGSRVLEGIPETRLGSARPLGRSLIASIRHGDRVPPSGKPGTREAMPTTGRRPGHPSEHVRPVAGHGRLSNIDLKES